MRAPVGSWLIVKVVLVITVVSLCSFAQWDVTPPTTPGDFSVEWGGTDQDVVAQFKWTASTDDESGVAGYRMFFLSTCCGPILMNPDGLIDDTSLEYHFGDPAPWIESGYQGIALRAVDNAGNESEAATVN